MPAIITRGAISAQGFGFAASGVCALDGTKGIFALGCNGANSTVRNKYTYVSCSNTASGVGAASLASRAGSGAGNSTKGIFALGLTNIGAGPSTVRNKYTYATCSSTACGVGSASAASYGGVAAGTGTAGIFALGGQQCGGLWSSTTTTNKYTYASCSSAAATSLPANTKYGAAVGNSTRGIFAVGCFNTCAPFCSCFARSNQRKKYTYATCSVTCSGVATATNASIFQSAAGNSTRGIFAIGSITCGYVTTRNKYTYACCSNTSCGVGSASCSSAKGSATGNSTRGIFHLGCINAGGSGTRRNKYTYATCASTSSGVACSSASARLGSATSWATGVNT